jgi:predicted Rossmann-fold nucleotide-binding protein
LQLIDHMKAEGFIHTANLVNPLVVDQAQDIVPAIMSAATYSMARGNDAVIERL